MAGKIIPGKLIEFRLSLRINPYLSLREAKVHGGILLKGEAVGTEVIGLKLNCLLKIILPVPD